MIRTANPDDIPALLEIENASFPGDRLSRRSFRHRLSDANAIPLVDADAAAGPRGAVRGYVTLLFRASASVARIYSFATHPACCGRGIAAALLLAAERAALVQRAALMRLKIRMDNHASQRLFLRHGYEVFGEYAAYYEDGEHAWRLEKPLDRASNQPPEEHHDHRHIDHC